MAYLAILEHENGTIKIYKKFTMQAEAEAHVQAVIGEYPNAFAIEQPGDMRHYKLDSATKTFSFDPDIAELDARVKRAIRAEGMRRLGAFMDDADFEVGAGMYLTLKRASGQAWTQAEGNMAATLLARFTYVRDLYVTAKQAIFTVDGLTTQEKIDFNAATDVAWPTPP